MGKSADMISFELRNLRMLRFLIERLRKEFREEDLLLHT